jgi:hypothetical protein
MRLEREAIRRLQRVPDARTRRFPDLVNKALIVKINRRLRL